MPEEINSYSEFAEFYDAMTDPAEKLSDFIPAYLKRKRLRLKKAADIGCGTGKFSLALARLGFKVTGIDASAGMLEIAAKKAEAEKLAIKFAQADMRSFSMPEKQELIVCGDAINSILAEKDLESVFRNVFANLGKNGAFIFDANTLKDYSGRENWTGYGGHINENVSFIWEDYVFGDRCEIELVLFRKQPNGLYRKEKKVLVENGYPIKTIKFLLEKAGFSKIEILTEKMKKASEKDTRVYFTARK
ncbi:MAG: class I SAM-dependent methyltransferase [Candidatus Diapherotrites archaeon]|nr:class I SAM-dependent methyltransferase [Candidatus Diapherotrites archaeon]